MHQIFSAVGLVELIGYAAVAVNIAVYSMKTMIPLRLAAIASNGLFIVYAGLTGVYPNLLLNCILLPLNVLRLVQMRRLIVRVQQAARGAHDYEWLKPFTHRRHYEPGIVFRRGETATEMFFIMSGRFRLRELDLDVERGSLIGELGMLAPAQIRTQTLECVEAGEVLVIGYDETWQLFLQNPSFGAYFLKLSSARLFDTIARLESRLAEQQPAAR